MAINSVVLNIVVCCNTVSGFFFFLTEITFSPEGVLLVELEGRGVTSQLKQGTLASMR